jgi:16S rRNA G966 N2-methylase RsmD
MGNECDPHANIDQQSPTEKAVGGNDRPSLKQISLLAVADLSPAPHNPRKHSRAQIRAIARSIETFGFNAPILIDRNRQIIAGHGRYEAAKLSGHAQVPVIFLDHLTETQAKAYMLADNKLTDRSTWDDAKVAVQLKELSDLVLDFDIEAIGFELPEIDFRIQSLEASDATDKADEFEPVAGPSVSIAGDLWLLGPHRLYCGNALDITAYVTLMETEKAAAVFTDPPYNVKIDGHVSGNGSVTHREFAMASGEMTPPEFTEFLTASVKLVCAHAAPGALVFACMDWRHMGEMLAAGQASECELLNLCVWAKSNGGMGSLYRSRHELVFVFRNGKEAHLNNVQLGRHGRNRTNVWNYPGFNGFARKGSKDASAFHPTVKPIALVADAIMDSTKRDDIVLDPYVGSGTTILAAERTSRRCFGIDIDGRYVDTAIARWERLTGRTAQNAQGQTFAQVKLERGIGQ